MLGPVHHFQKLDNFRDVGGLATADGGTVRAGLLFRSAAPAKLPEGDRTALRSLGLRLICDLRTPQQRRRRRVHLGPGADIPTVSVPLHEPGLTDGGLRLLLSFLFGAAGGDRFRRFISDFYRDLAFEQAAAIGTAVTLLAQEDSLPALIHCSAGKDRTGVLAALLQLLLGVPFDVVVQQYLRTNDAFAARLPRFIRLMRFLTFFQASPERLRLVLMADPEPLIQMHDAIKARHGSVERSLTDACAVAPDALESLKRRLLA